MKYLFDMFHILKANRPSVIINYTIKPILAGGLISFILRIPSISFFAGLNSGLSNKIKSKGVKAWIVKRLLKLILSVNRFNIFLNEEDKELMCENGIIKRNKAILLKGGEGVDVNHYQPVTFYHNDNKLKFVMVARVLKTKGYEEFAEAALRCKKHYNANIEFYLCGGIDTIHPDRVDIETIRKDEEAGSFQYMGHINNINQFLSDADCVILPSYYNEGMNRSLMEALSMGIPIITSDNRGCRELVRDGVTGFVIPPKNTDRLYEAILKFINLSDKERYSMREESRKYALERFDVKQVIETYKYIIDNSIKS